MILVDTSIWIDHFHKSLPRLVELLENEEVLTHPFVIGELACGALVKRTEVLSLLSALPSAVTAAQDESLGLIERHRLMGKGLAYVDVHLLASVMLTDAALLWTRDKALRGIAERFGLGFEVV